MKTTYTIALIMVVGMGLLRVTAGDPCGFCSGSEFYETMECPALFCDNDTCIVRQSVANIDEGCYGMYISAYECNTGRMYTGNDKEHVGQCLNTNCACLFDPEDYTLVPHDIAVPLCYDGQNSCL